MKKEWYSSDELKGLGNLPGSTQGVNQKARKQHWQRRKKEGIQGKAIEYHITSLPEDVQFELKMREDSMQYSVNGYIPVPHLKPDPFVIWMSTYHQLTPKERDQLINILIRVGVNGIIDMFKKE